MSLPSTQRLLDVQDVRDDLLVLKNGQFCLILQTTSINFDLLSEAEQDAMIAAYAQMINSLTFPLQIMVRTRRMDISNYLIYLESFEKRQLNKALRDQIIQYREFVRQLVVSGNILTKRFYIIVPYQTSEVNKLNSFEKIFAQISRKEKVVKVSAREFEAAKIHLKEKKEELTALLSRIGLKAPQLTSKQIVELLYEAYNPTEATLEHLRPISEYTTPFVQPSME